MKYTLSYRDKYKRLRLTEFNDENESPGTEDMGNMLGQLMDGLGYYPPQLVAYAIQYMAECQRHECEGWAELHDAAIKILARYGDDEANP